MVHPVLKRGLLALAFRPITARGRRHREITAPRLPTSLDAHSCVFCL